MLESAHRGHPIRTEPCVAGHSKTARWQEGGLATAADDRTRRQARRNPRPDIPARLVESACLGGEGSGEYVLDGARVVGSLELSGRLIERSLRFTDCEFTRAIWLEGAQASAGIHLDNCDIRAFRADRLSVGGDLVLESVRCRGGLISLRGARVAGHLRCTGSHLSCPHGKVFTGRGMMIGASALFDGDFHAEGEFVLTDAQVGGSIDMKGATFTNKNGLAIDAQSVKAAEIRLDEGFTATGAVRLDGASVSGRLLCIRGQFRNEAGTALAANGLECRDVRLGEGFVAKGAVHLIGAIIGRELNCSRGRFDNKDGTAINADGLACEGKIYFDDKFEADGEVLLRNARVRTELNCSNGTFRNEGRIALSAGGLDCQGDVYLNEDFKACGEVELTDVTIGRRLNCERGSFTKFSAARLTVGTTFDWRPRQAPEQVDLSFADVGLLVDAPQSWPSGDPCDPPTKLTGLNFKDVGDEKDWPRCDKDRIKGREEWLKNASYAPGVYHQLARIYDQRGREGAREISIAGQRDRRERGGISWWARQWNRFLDCTVRYGYSLHRPLLVVLAAGILGIGLFYLALYFHVMEAVGGATGAAANASSCTPSYPCFFPPAYALEILLPVINLRQVSFWLPSASTGFGKFLFAWVWLAIAFGWVVSVALAAGIGHLFSRRD